MSKDTKQSMDPFTAELEKAGVKDIQEAIIWKLGDIVKSSETIVELSGNCDDSFCQILPEIGIRPGGRGTYERRM